MMFIGYDCTKLEYCDKDPLGLYPIVVSSLRGEFVDAWVWDGSGPESEDRVIATCTSMEAAQAVVRLMLCAG
jgi:hypothetical protein